MEAAVPSAPGFPSFTAPPALFPSVVFLSLFLAPLTSSLLSLNQDKLSEEVQKLQVGLEATRAEPADAELDGSQADEDRDRTKLLLERLKTLEVVLLLLCSLPLSHLCTKARQLIKSFCDRRATSTRMNSSFEVFRGFEFLFMVQDILKKIEKLRKF